MKITNIAWTLVLSATIIVTALPFNAFAEEPVLMPKQETVGDVTYVTGGIGQSEAEIMRTYAKDYTLEIVFVQKLKQLEEYIANVNVQIQDTQKNALLNVMTEGPFLLANMPQGKYVISAEYNGITKQQRVNIGAKKHQRLVFWWPKVEQHEAESAVEQ